MSQTAESNGNLSLQKLIVLVGVALFLLKIVAWYLTNSVAILTDALESTVNVVASFIGLYSLWLSAQPRDVEHPYGHGKVEFISASLEGTLISLAGFYIIYEAIGNLRHPTELGQLDLGILLIAVSAAVNFGVGWLAVRRGEKTKSLALVASGKHLQSDTYTTLGIIFGLALLWLTGWVWIDSVVALVFAFLIIYTGYKILRSSVAGIMDEADKELIAELVAYLDRHREPNWIDIHNLRIIKYGSVLHLDFHLTVPWYLMVIQAHEEVEKIEKIIREKFGDSVEMFVHLDACIESSCPICTVKGCPVRKAAFQNRVAWDVQNISADRKHGGGKT
ncbi:MAG: cation diffusion facilitator family transporter [Bacteroidota bacterium]